MRRVHRTVLFICVGVSSLAALVACGAPGGGPDRTVLAPGTTLEGPGGTRLVAPPEVLAEAVGVSLSHTHLPERAMEEDLVPVGTPLRVIAEARAASASGEPFLLEMPIPAGLDPATAGIAVYLEQGESAFHDTAGHPLDEPFWDLVELESRDGGRTATLELALLPASGLIVQMVHGAEFYEAEAVVLQGHGASFRILCRRKHQAICDQFGDDATEALVTAHARFSDMGFAEPLLAKTRSGDYKIRLRPYKVTDKNGTCHVDTDLEGRTGRYNYPLRRITVCVGGGPFAGVTADDGWTDDRTDVAAHELFHAVQYRYTQVAMKPLQMWSMEGTAALSQTSTATSLERADLLPRPVDVPLDRNFIVGDGGGNQYRTQDFFAYLGDVIAPGQGLAYLQDVFRSGAAPPAVSSAIAGFGHPTLTDLSSAYWAWARNQTFEKSVRTPTDDDADHPDGAACALLPDVASPELFVLTEGSTSRDGTLPPLTSAVMEVRTEAGPLADGSITLSVTAPQDGVRAAFYDPGDCGNPVFGTEATFEMPAGTSATYYALIANTQFRQGRTRDYTFDAAMGEVDPVVEIVAPASGDTFREHDASLTLQAIVDATPGTADAYTIGWSYGPADAPTSLGTTTSGETLTVSGLPCEPLVIRAEVATPSGGTARDLVPVSCVAQEETYLLHPTWGNSGGVRSDGAVTLAGSLPEQELRVGDDAGNRAMQGNLEVTLATLPDDLARISSAVLTLSFEEPVALPAPNMAELAVLHVDYGDTLGPEDYLTGDGIEFLPGRGFSDDLSFGQKELDVTLAVQNAWENRDTRGERVQFLLRIDPAATNGDGVANYLPISYEDRPGTFLLPALSITFENY